MTIRSVAVVALLAGGFARAGYALPTCDVGGVDQPALEAVNAAIASTCPCAATQSPADFKRCVKGVVRSALEASQLTVGCARFMLKMYLPSTCGYPAGSVACARRNLTSQAQPRCRILVPDRTCTPASNRIACASPFNCYNANIDTYTFPGPVTGSCSIGQ